LVRKITHKSRINQRPGSGQYCVCATKLSKDDVYPECQNTCCPYRY